MPIIKIHNAETNEVIEREMTSEELAQLDASLETAVEEEQQTKSAKAALLERLGITEDEAKLLLA